MAPEAARNKGNSKFSSAYGGSKVNKEVAVSFHRLAQDLRERIYAKYQVRELVVHVLMLLCFVAFVSQQLALSRVTDMQRAVEQIFVSRPFPSSTVDRFFTFHQVSSDTDVAQYVVNVLHSNLLSPANFAGSNYTTIASSNTLLWGVRFRAIAVQPGKDCLWRGPETSVHDSSATLEPPSCIPAFSDRTELTEGGSYSCFSYVRNTGEHAFRSRFNTYPGSGFVEDVYISETAAEDVITAERAMLERLHALFTLRDSSGQPSSSSILQRNTAALIVSVTLFNPNINVVAFTRLLFEFLPSGLVVPTADVGVAPFVLHRTSSDRGTLVAGGFLAVFIVLRIVFVVLNAINLTRLRPRSSSWASRGLLLLFDMGMTAILVLVLFDLFFRVFFEVGNKELAAAIKGQDEMYFGAADTVRWFWNVQWVFSYFVIILAVYMFKYMRLFYGLRFLWCVGFVAMRDLLTFYVILFTWVAGLGCFLYLTYGPFAVAYATLRQAFKASLLQSVGYFSVHNVAYASPFVEPVITALYVAFTAIVLNLVLLNVYVAIILKAFGIVYNETLRLDGDPPRPELANVGGGIRPLLECTAWCSRNRVLCGKLCSSESSLGTLLLSVFCCTNHYRRDWLSDGAVLRRLVEWRRRRQNQNQNFLTFKELRAALQGDRKDFKEVSNYQVDALMSACSLRISTAEALQVQRTVNEVMTGVISTAEFQARVLQYAKQQGWVDEDEGDAARPAKSEAVLDDFQGTLDAFLDLKRKQTSAELQLAQQFDKVSNRQTAILSLLGKINEATTDLNAIPGRK